MSKKACIKSDLRQFHWHSACGSNFTNHQTFLNHCPLCGINHPIDRIRVSNAALKVALYRFVFGSSKMNYIYISLL